MKRRRNAGLQMNTEILTFDETRKYLKVSRSTLYRLVQSHAIPASKVGRAWRFREERLVSWLEKQERVK